MKTTAVVSTNGQVVIPIEVRRRLGIKPGTRLHFEVNGPKASLQVASARKPSTVAEGSGLLRYSGPPIAVEDMDPVAALKPIKRTRR
jgi:AbrB family looped-hinge helix DNA binding protein